MFEENIPFLENFFVAPTGAELGANNRKKRVFLALFSTFFPFVIFGGLRLLRV
jgi:hypothetical protein